MNGFDTLLAALDPDRERAGAAYEELRLRLVKFFSWEGCLHPEDWADEVLARVAKKLEAGESIENVIAYAAGVARFALKEAFRQEQRSRPLEGDFAAAPPVELPDPRLAECLTRCLSELPKDGRTLILDYYQGDAGARIRQRQAMAARLGVSLNSLRNRALRLRDRLEKCLTECTGRDVSPGSDTKKKGDA